MTCPIHNSEIESDSKQKRLLTSLYPQIEYAVYNKLSAEEAISLLCTCQQTKEILKRLAAKPKPPITSTRIDAIEERLAKLEKPITYIVDDGSTQREVTKEEFDEIYKLKQDKVQPKADFSDTIEVLLEWIKGDDENFPNTECPEVVKNIYAAIDILKKAQTK